MIGAKVRALHCSDYLRSIVHVIKYLLPRIAYIRVYYFHLERGKVFFIGFSFHWGKNEGAHVAARNAMMQRYVFAGLDNDDDVDDVG